MHGREVSKNYQMTNLRQYLTGKATTCLLRTIATPSIFFLVLALAVMGPLLSPGYIMALDAPLALNWDLAGFSQGSSDGPGGVFAATYTSAPIAAVLKALSFVIPAWAVEKLWLVLLLWLCGIGASRLPYLKGLGRFYAGTFYMLNPFSYIRLVTGQWGVLATYALLPFTIIVFLQLLENPRPRHAIKLALLLTAVGLVQVHGIGVTFVALAVLFIGRIAMSRMHIRNTLKMLGLALVIFLSLNSFWIVRYALAQFGAVRNMPIAELAYFAASPLADVVSLRGYWLSQAYTDISDILSFWWIFFAPLLFFLVHGFIELMRSKRLRWLATSLILILGLGLFLAAGPGLNQTEPMFRSLWEHIPFYRSFRDSHKFVALVALGYAYLGAFGVRHVANLLSTTRLGTRPARIVISGLVLIMLVIYGLPIFGAWGQLRPAHFPEDWHQTRAILDSDRSDYNVLVLPWHMYMQFPWLPASSKQLANPASNFFSQPVISGDNLEISDSYSNSSNPVSKYVEALLDQRESTRTFGEQIAPLNAKYVILFKSSDHEAYDFLQEQRDLQVEFEGNTIALYRNSHPTAKQYTVDSVVRLNSLEDYLERPSDQGPLDYLYLLDCSGEDLLSDSHVTNNAGTPQHGCDPESGRIPEGRYLVSVLPQRTTRTGWQTGGTQAVFNLGMMPAFPLDPETGSPSFIHFYRIHLPLYVLTAVSLIACVLIWRRWP